MSFLTEPMAVNTSTVCKNFNQSMFILFLDLVFKAHTLQLYKIDGTIPSNIFIFASTDKDHSQKFQNLCATYHQINQFYLNELHCIIIYNQITNLIICSSISLFKTVLAPRPPALLHPICLPFATFAYFLLSSPLKFCDSILQLFPLSFSTMHSRTKLAYPLRTLLFAFMTMEIEVGFFFLLSSDVLTWYPKHEKKNPPCPPSY